MENSRCLSGIGHADEKKGVASFGRIFPFKVVQPLHSATHIPQKAVTDRLSNFLPPGNNDISPTGVRRESMLYLVRISCLPLRDTIGQCTQVLPHIFCAPSFLYRLSEGFRPRRPLMLVVASNLDFETNVDAVGLRRGLTEPHDVMGGTVAGRCRMCSIDIILQPIKLRQRTNAPAHRTRGPVTRTHHSDADNIVHSSQTESCFAAIDFSSNAVQTLEANAHDCP